MTGLSTAVWSGVFVHSVEQLAGMCRFHFWDPADVLTDERRRYAAGLPTKRSWERWGRLFLTKPIKERLMKMGCIHPPSLCFWQGALIWKRRRQFGWKESIKGAVSKNNKILWSKKEMLTHSWLYCCLVICILRQSHEKPIDDTVEIPLNVTLKG